MINITNMSEKLNGDPLPLGNNQFFFCSLWLYGVYFFGKKTKNKNLST